ncbi:ADP-ribosylation/Crystallin J1 [Poronia punctata]|nr:ADP-ribosylation/Crystallin J1 [Poronia punctata]
MGDLPHDYLERVYAGVLGKLIGVYLGRPFEGWTHQKIMDKLGPIRYYVNEKLGVPLVVTDDDVSGTFTFVRAIEEHDDDAKKKGRSSSLLPAENIGKTWLNNVVYRRSVFFWGGKGIMTEHTAYVNLKNGMAAPLSGATETNGATIAEQIGAQIFIDGWALVAPGNPLVASNLAEAAASVSHDGKAVHAAMVWAAMESEAFLSKDIDHLLVTGLGVIPPDSFIATLIKTVRRWTGEDGNWLITRQRIEDSYGYDKFPGICHVVPNHAIMIMALIYGGHDFAEAMHIVNTCGWDTDSNAGNLACLVAIMHGLAGFEGNLDWRGPLADRALISSADGGYSINNAARLALDIANLGRKLAGEETLPPPKHGAQFHFTLPGSVQGFQARTAPESGSGSSSISIAQGIDHTNSPALAIRISGLARTMAPVEVTTPTFSAPDVRSMPLYDLVASPLVYPGQTIKALLRAEPSNTGAVSVRLVLKAYSFTDELESHFGDHSSLSPGSSIVLEWIVPSSIAGRPIQCVGVTLSSPMDRPFKGTVWLDSLGWQGTPHVILRETGSEGPLDFYKRAFVNAADSFHVFGGKYWVAKDDGQGVVSYGTKEWTDYKVRFRGFAINMGNPAGVLVRVQGINRYYALEFASGGRIRFVKALDNERVELAAEYFSWEVDARYTITVKVAGGQMSAQVEDVTLFACDRQYQTGGIGLLVNDGSLSVNTIEIGPID